MASEHPRDESEYVKQFVFIQFVEEYIDLFYVLFFHRIASPFCRGGTCVPVVV